MMYDGGMKMTFHWMFSWVSEHTEESRCCYCGSLCQRQLWCSLHESPSMYIIWDDSADRQPLCWYLSAADCDSCCLPAAATHRSGSLMLLGSPSVCASWLVSASWIFHEAAAIPAIYIQLQLSPTHPPSLSTHHSKAHRPTHTHPLSVWTISDSFLFVLSLWVLLFALVIIFNLICLWQSCVSNH